jgi:hypothetical protein
MVAAAAAAVASEFHRESFLFTLPFSLLWSTFQKNSNEFQKTIFFYW